jgi:prepilin-type N-terminal cleavage/methylation domain-containing protein
MHGCVPIKKSEKMNNTNQYNSGFSLLELLLAVGIMAGLTTGAASLFDQWAKNSVNRKVATEMQRVQDAAKDYVEFNFENVVNDDVPNVGNIAEIDIDDVIDAGFLPNSFRPINSFNQEMRIIVRHVTDDGVNGDVLEVLTVGDNKSGFDSRVPSNRLFDAAATGGPDLGVISALDVGSECCDGNIQSIYGTWSVTLSDFAAIYSTTPNNDRGGYMAAYGRVSVIAEQDQPYLYRVAVPGQEHLNRMNTNLDMNNNNIINGGVIVSDSMSVDSGTFLGQETNNIESAYVLSVEDDLDVNQNMEILADGSNKGEIYIRGDDTAATDFIVTGTLKTDTDGGTVGHGATSDASGNVSANNMFVTNFTEMPNGVFQDMNFSSGNLTAGNIYGINMVTQGDIDTTSLQTSQAQNIRDINSANAVVGATTFSSTTANVSGNLRSAGSISTEGGLNVNGAVQGTETVRIQNLTCLSPGDCP